MLYEQALALVILAAHLGLAFAAAAWLRAADPPWRAHVVRATLAALVLLWLVSWTLGPHLPTAWITPLHEGFTPHHVRQVVGLGLGESPLHHRFWRYVLGPTDALLHQRVAERLAMALAGAVGLAAWARVVAGTWVAGALIAAACLLSPLGRHAALSETEGPFVALYLPWVAMAGWGLRHRAATARAVLLGVAATGLMALVRTEAGLLAAASLGLAALPPPWWARWAAAWDRALGTPARVLALLVVLPTAGLALAWRGPWLGHLGRGGQAAWLSEALDPGHGVWLLAPLAVAAGWSPGLAVLATLGWVRATRAPAVWGALLGAPWLWAVYRNAAHGTSLFTRADAATWELVRYAALAAAPLLLLALHGALWIAARSRPAALILGVLALGPPWDGALPWIGAAPRTGLPHTGLLDTDQQREVRVLLAQARATPACTIVTAGVRWGERTDDWVLLDGWSQVPTFRWLARAEAPTAPDALATLRGQGTCALYWRAVDCGALGRDPCGDPGVGAPLATATWASAPYVHPDHGVRWASRLDVGWYTLPGATPPDVLADPARPGALLPAR